MAKSLSDLTKGGVERGRENGRLSQWEERERKKKDRPCRGREFVAMGRERKKTNLVQWGEGNK